MKFRSEGFPGEFNVELTASGGDSVRVRINRGEEIVTIIDSTLPGSAIVRIGRRSARVFSTRWRGSIWVAVGPAQFEFNPVETPSTRRAHGLATPEVTAPMPGKVVNLPVTEGEEVEAGDVLIVLEAMKMETALHAESRAIVKQVRAQVGQMVDHGTVLLVLSPAPSRSDGGADPPAR
jgi:acetyl/propionyl-CoA carboxylase alpha subunit